MSRTFLTALIEASDPSIPTIILEISSDTG